jgi:hypothetical protein
MQSRDPCDQGWPITVLDEAGWDLVGWGHREVAWLFRRGSETRPIAAPTLIEAILLLLRQEGVIDDRDTSGTGSPPAGLS